MHPILVAVLFAIAVSGHVGPAAGRAQGPTAASQTVGDLANRALIRRDMFGVPHILADTEEAAAFAHGYVTAEDHGPALARLFLRARGAEAAVFGEAFAQSDALNHVLGIHATAAARFQELPPFMQIILDGYAAGYDLFLERHRSQFPEWATPVTGVDVLAHGRALLLLDFALDLRPWAAAVRRGTGSMMWAVGGALTISGHTMLLANPHVSWEGHPLFHEVQLTVPDSINVNGATLIGLPVVTIGFNEALGWTQTVNGVNGDDLYELTLDATGKQYQYDGRWLPLQSRSISIGVRTPDGVVQRARTVWSSHHGPIVRIDGQTAYAFKSANLALTNFLTQYNLMAKATSLETFRAALEMQQLPMFNIGYADRRGNIWYLFNGRIPFRTAGRRPFAPVPGNTSKTEWFALRPLADLPQLLNPRTGYVQNNNDAPWYTNLHERIDPSRFAGYIEGDGLGWRTQMSLRLLRRVSGLTLEEMVRHKFNAELLLATRLKRELLTLVDETGDQEAQKAESTLSAWDDRADAGSRGAVLFLEWWNQYSRTVARPFRVPWSAEAPLDTPTGIADPERARAAFAAAIRNVTQRHGALDVAWGDVHRLRRGNVDLPLGGTDASLWQVSYRRDRDGRLAATGGDTYVLAVEFRDGPPRALSVIPYSQSSNAWSAHFSDQARIYANESLKPAWFTEAEIEANTSRRYRPGQ